MVKKTETVSTTDERGQPKAGVKQPAQFIIPKRAPRANSGKFELQYSGMRFDTWLLRSEYGTTLETLLAPDFWAHVAKNLKPLDRIEVIPEGGLTFAELIVLATDENHTSARVRVMRTHNLYDLKQEDMETDTHEVTYRGEVSKWGVLRKDDSAVMKDGFLTPVEAVAFMRDHLIKADAA